MHYVLDMELCNVVQGPYSPEAEILERVPHPNFVPIRGPQTVDNGMYAYFMDEIVSSTDSFQREHSTLQFSCRKSVVNDQHFAPKDDGLQFTHPLFAMKWTCVIDALPNKWGALAHHTPVLLFPIDDTFHLCFDSSEARPIIRTPLQDVSAAARLGQTRRSDSRYHEYP